MISAFSLELGKVFGSHMVLPAGAPVPIWGTAAPGAEVEVSFAGIKRSVVADRHGQWRVEWPEMKPSFEAASLRVRAGDQRVEIVDVLVGEVWLCAGQSNMDFPLSKALGGRQEAKAAGEFPAIRLFNLSGVHTSGRPYRAEELKRLDQDRFFEGSWKQASTESALPFSAVGWWAGKEIHRGKGVPIGLIDCSVGGSGTEAWIPIEKLKKRREYAGLLGSQWLESEQVSPWARGRAKLNLGEAAARHPFEPGFLFDSGIRMWRAFPLSGVLWYQGETNAEIHDDEWNQRLIMDLIAGWREEIESRDLPFFMVELPRIGGKDPMRQWWPQYRKVQARVARLDGVTLVKTTDLGWDSPNVHPPDKRPVGERLGRTVANQREFR